MNLFTSLQPSKTSRKKLVRPFANIVCLKAKDEKINIMNNRKCLELSEMDNLLNFNKKRKHPYNPDSIRLWSILDMKTYLDAFYDLTINPYVDKNRPVKDLDFYLDLTAKYLNILDIKLLGSFKIENIEFKKVLLVTYEIKDKKEEYYRPYVELFVPNDDESFQKIGYGYDTNDNANVELFIENLNYAIYLTSKGTIKFPFKSKTLKLSVDDIITDININNLISGVYVEDIEIRTDSLI